MQIGPPNRLLLQGCEKNVSMLQIEGRNQYIFLCGEDHRIKGNSEEFIQNLTGQTNCPIDIFIEKPFETYWRVPIKNTQSNSIRFYFPPFDICTDPLKVPKDPELLSPKFKEYKINCLDPYRGKIKFWAIDIRRTSIFYLIQRLSYSVISYFYNNFPVDPDTHLKKTIENDKNLRDWIELVKKTQKTLFEFQLFAISPDLYEKKILDGIIELYKKTPSFLLDFASSMEIIFNTRPIVIEQEFKKLKRSIDKSHLDFAKSVLEISKYDYETIKQWKTFLNQLVNTELIYCLCCNQFMDLNTILKMTKVLQKQKEGFLFFFAGYVHTDIMERMLLNICHPSLPKIKKINEFSCEIGNHTTVTIPTTPCKLKVPARMNIYS